jgi:hypothetical protein
VESKSSCSFAFGQACNAGQPFWINSSWMGDEPHAQRRSWLNNNNPAGDLSSAPRCGAKTRQGKGCRGPAMRNGRCGCTAE